MPVTINTTSGKRYTVLTNVEFAERVGKHPQSTKRWANAGHPAARSGTDGLIWLWELYSDSVVQSMYHNGKPVQKRPGPKPKYGR